MITNYQCPICGARIGLRTEEPPEHVPTCQGSFPKKTHSTQTMKETPK